MAFTFLDTFLTNRDKLRFDIGDTQENTSPEQGGPRPDKRNFSDNEIAYFLLTQGDSVSAATGQAFEVLASEWTIYSRQEKQGDISFDAKGLAQIYVALAKDYPHKTVDGESSLTLGLNFQATDDDGNVIIPPFQRDQFGNEIIDW